MSSRRSQATAVEYPVPGADLEDVVAVVDIRVGPHAHDEGRQGRRRCRGSADARWRVVPVWFVAVELGDQGLVCVDALQPSLGVGGGGDGFPDREPCFGARAGIAVVAGDMLVPRHRLDGVSPYGVVQVPVGGHSAGEFSAQRFGCSVDVDVLTQVGWADRHWKVNISRSPHAGTRSLSRSATERD